jgi:hypothetical protein
MKKTRNVAALINARWLFAVLVNAFSTWISPFLHDRSNGHAIGEEKNTDNDNSELSEEEWRFGTAQKLNLANSPNTCCESASFGTRIDGCRPNLFFMDQTIDPRNDAAGTSMNRAIVPSILFHRATGSPVYVWRLLEFRGS